MDYMPLSPLNNPSLPVVVQNTTERAEIDLILRQLFMLKQDTELIQKILVNNPHPSAGDVAYPDANAIENGIPIPPKSMEIVEMDIALFVMMQLVTCSLKILKKQLNVLLNFQ